VVAAVSPRAIDKRARPGNEFTPGPTGPPVTTADFEQSEPAMVEAAEAGADVIDGVKD
jgi:hypothetical protein